MIHAVDHMHFDRPRLVGRPNLGIIFFDSVSFTPELVCWILGCIVVSLDSTNFQISAAERNFDGIIVGSTWNAQVWQTTTANCKNSEERSSDTEEIWYQDTRSPYAPSTTVGSLSFFKMN